MVTQKHRGRQVVMHFFAHADDSVTANTAAQTSPEIIVGVLGLLVLLLLWLLATYLLKWRIGGRLNLVTAFLFLVGVTNFSEAPIAATVALAAGMALALFSVVVSVASAKN